ncbi:hypothetical protein Ae201684P_005776 [Aphanomyces euteiches]|uniref:Uncharacterized protein n=1 Tax=Aphanomyces euteiches TaxID=100861 RepID=A0A6G0WWI2_9STRA|nr:hypothetical protein Ae201684_010950 [Aphanomyces euteiches]KAH9058433.1 hypothetical protein Ae201684P_005776 [Aphanomyces euteiches]
MHTSMSSPTLVAMKSQAPSHERKKSNRFIVIDAPDDPELLSSPSNAADNVRNGVSGSASTPLDESQRKRIRQGKTEQKGRFTIIDLVPTSPVSEEIDAGSSPLRSEEAPKASSFVASSTHEGSEASLKSPCDRNGSGTVESTKPPLLPDSTRFQNFIKNQELKKNELDASHGQGVKAPNDASNFMMPLIDPRLTENYIQEITQEIGANMRILAKMNMRNSALVSEFDSLAKRLRAQVSQREIKVDGLEHRTT